MSRNASGSARLPIAALALALFGEVTPAIAEQRPLEDFLARQSTWCLVPNEEGTDVDCAASYYGGPDCLSGGFALTFPLFWTDQKTGITALVDVLGDLDEGSLGTSVTGSISEGGGPDGSAQVNVKLDTANAVVRAFDPEFAPLFGFGEGNPLGPPTLGVASAQMIFKNTARGAVLPDTAQLDLCPEPGQAKQMLSISARARGPLREASGFPVGTPGRMHMTGHVNGPTGTTNVIVQPSGP